MGAASPGRWQAWQFFCKMGRMSLWKVTGAESAAASVPVPIITMRNAFLDMSPPG
jgi:hypothetical protein